ncbi:MAG: carboxymuconolactone decarboxylase family protein [Chloroflexi bacterium]|nr:MAG: carboxymuconolactone decarboxylase family protein [Chloroflexota bacterium]
MTQGISDVRTTLRALATSDNMIQDLLRVQESNIERSGLDPHTWSLVKLAALVSIDAAPASYIWHITTAQEAGVTAEEMVGVLVALAPTVGVARIIAAAPEVAIGLGIETDDEGEEEDDES